jgi:hypothetical protein
MLKLHNAAMVFGIFKNAILVPIVVSLKAICKTSGLSSRSVSLFLLSQKYFARDVLRLFRSEYNPEEIILELS